MLSSSGADLFQLWSNCLDISFLCLYLSPFVFFAQPGCPGSAYLFQWSTCVHTCSEPPQLSDGGGRDQVSTEFQVFLRYSVSSPPPSVRPRTLVQPFTSKRVAKVQFWHVPLILSCLPLLWASCCSPVQHGGPGPA